MKRRRRRLDLTSAALLSGTVVCGIFRQELLAVLFLIAAVSLIALMIGYAWCADYKEQTDRLVDQRVDELFEEAVRNADIRVKQQLFIVNGQGYK